jgi:tetratricopeptide (TPR) repeat protein
MQLGFALDRKGQHDEAIAACRKANELKPDDASLQDSLGFFLYRQGKLDEAIACFRKVIELNPKNAKAHNDAAWFLATGADPKFRDPKLAVELARKAVELAPRQGMFWNTLGVAHYRVGKWKDGIAALKKSDELIKGEMFSFNAFFLAMAHWRLDEKDEARKWYDQAAAWMEKNKPQDEELQRFREEATELLGVKGKKD